MRVYISGGITNVPNYMDNFTIAEISLKQRGYEVVNPAKINALLPTSCEYEDYMKMSICELSLCDTIYMLKGYQTSKGALRELEYAKEHDYKILLEV